MTDPDRYRLLFGPYATPVFKYGDDGFCEVRGEVIHCGLTAGRIPWSVGKKKENSRARSIVVCGALADAVRRESAQAVAYWWGVTPQTITVWRKALDVSPTTEGTHQLRHDYALEPAITAALEKALAKAADPERCAKIAAAKKGKPRPKHVGKAVAKAHRGKRHSADARAKMSEAHRQRGARPPKAGRPWTAEEEALLRELPPAEVAKRTGRTLKAVYSWRRALGLPDLRFKQTGE